MAVAGFGLLRLDGSEKPAAAAFREVAAKQIHSLWPSMAEPKPEPERPNPWGWWTPEALAAAAECPVAAVRENWPRLVEQMTHAGIYGRMVAIAMIGTIAKESASTFRPVREAFYLGEPEPAESYRKTLRYYPYFGRGFIQNTWEENYRALGPKIAQLWGAGGWEPDFDLVGNPDQLLDPDFSAAAAAIFFRDKAGGALLLAARSGQWDQVRRYVLGGPDPEGTARIARIAVALGTTGPDVPAGDPKDALIAAYEIALRTLRDVTLPAIEARLAGAEAQLDAAQTELDEAARIVRQFAPA
jgi:hypothetical protein